MQSHPLWNSDSGSFEASLNRSKLNLRHLGIFLNHHALKIILIITQLIQYNNGFESKRIFNADFRTIMIADFPITIMNMDFQIIIDVDF